MPRTLLVGFDGANLDLADRWMAEGRMPNLAGLCREGSFGTMRSTYPYNSAVAWTSLSTGASAGRHGIFDFVLPGGKDYRLRVATREDRRVPALGGYASARGAPVGRGHLPLRLPPSPLQRAAVVWMGGPRAGA